MGFIAVILAYVISISLTGQHSSVQGYVARWQGLVFERGWNSKLALTIYSLLPALILGAVLAWLGSGFLVFVVSVVMLLLAFRAGDQPDKLDEFRRKQEAGESSEAWHVAVESLGLEQHLYEPNDPNLQQGVQSGISYLYLERFFVPVFWFVVFGPAGVLFVWLVGLSTAEQPNGSFCERVKQALYWFPVRLMTFTLALMGNFMRCFPVWLGEVRVFERNDRELLVRCTEMALVDIEAPALLDETIQLMKRSQLAWLVVLALILIFGIG